MTVGVIMLAHTALGRATQVARYWSAAGCPVVIHVDKKVPRHTHDAFVQSLSDQPQLRFSDRFHCEWGTWGITASTKAAVRMMLDNHPDVKHVYLSSGSCLPLRPVADLQTFLEGKESVDFIESVAVSDVRWTVGGLEKERFTLVFPLAWKKNRFLFDRLVELQRRVKFERKVPEGLVPHMGSQWWCLSRRTLTAILEDPMLPKYDAYFRRVWIPDEAYFQSLARLHSAKIESRSLTLSKFDFQGKPHVFYDDHLQLLRRSDAFVARKIWPFADRLYDTFLNNAAGVMQRAEPDQSKVDQVFAAALHRRTKGRPGLYTQSRFPRNNWENGVTAAPYSVMQGFSELFIDFENWLADLAQDARVHGRLFHKKKIQYAGGAQGIAGALSDNVALRNYNAKAFLTNLIWNTRGERQCFQFSAADQQRVRATLVKDANAEISVITGAWAIPLFNSDLAFAKIRNIASDLQKTESAFLKMLKAPSTKASVRIWSLADVVLSPAAALEHVLIQVRADPKAHVSAPPPMATLDGFGKFLQRLSNEGLHPYSVGAFPSEVPPSETPKEPIKPYLVR
ncbi:MAG: beta-1,6-N-acetylglucosaminyltransferase [Pseudomonadota bacterium]